MYLMSENPVACDRQCHVDAKFHFLRERVHLGELRLIKCHGPRNVADAFTKILPRPVFHQHREFMWVTRTPFRAFYTRSFSSVVTASAASHPLACAPTPAYEILFPVVVVTTLCVFLFLWGVMAWWAVFGPSFQGEREVCCRGPCRCSRAENRHCSVLSLSATVLRT